MSNLNGFVNGDLGLDSDYITDAQVAGMFGEAEQIEGLGAVPRRFIAKTKQDVIKMRQAARAVRSNKGSDASKETDNLTWRSYALNRFKEFPDYIQEQLKNGLLKMVDHELYFAKAAAGQNVIKMITSNDKKMSGIGNVSNAKLENGQFFICTGIVLLSGVGADDNEASGKAVTYGEATPAIINGDFEFKQGSETLVDTCACQIFKRGVNERVGFVKLGNPRILKPQTEMSFTLNCGVTPVANTWVKVILVGGITTSAIV